MDKENVVHLPNGILLSCKNDDLMKFAGKWKELEKIILSVWLLKVKDRITDL